MYCSNCGVENLPTDTRCLRCGTSLLKRTEGISDALKKPVEAIDKSIAGRICGFLGFIVAVLLCNTVFSRFYLSDSEIYLIATISA